MTASQTYSSSTREIARLLGQQVRIGRLQRGWTMAELASRIGVSEVTLRKVERGNPGVALGTAIEAANLVGVALYESADHRARESRRLAETLALLPSAAHGRRNVDNDF